MNQLSFERWREFATRMARTCYAESIDPDLAFILGEVDHFFDCLGAEEVFTIESWDHSGPYRRETGYFKDRQCRCRHRTEPPPPCVPHDAWMRAHNSGLDCDAADAFVKWRYGDEPCTCCSHHARYRGPQMPDPDCPDCGGDPDWRRMANGPYVCDIMTEQGYESMPCAPDCAFCRRPSLDAARWKAREAGLSAAASSSYAEWRHETLFWFRCTCDEVSYDWEEAWLEQWFGPVHCCVRAGIDFASEPSAGVVGFTAGDVRRMWPDGVPDWVFPPDEKLHYAFTIPPVVNGTFAELPDSAGVML
jgi:hypothetical protein